MPDTDPLGIDWTRRNSFLLLHLDVLGFTLPKTSSSHLPGGRNPKGNYSLPTYSFSGPMLVSGRVVSVSMVYL